LSTHFLKISEKYEKALSGSAGGSLDLGGY
jgi:hypothetical protein